MIIWWPELSEGQLILKVPLSCQAVSPQLLIWMSVFYVSPGFLISSAGFKGFAATCDSGCPCLSEGRWHFWLTANCSSVWSEADKQIHSHIYDAVLRHGPDTSEIRNNWRSRGDEINRERYSERSVCARRLVNLYQQSGAAVQMDSSSDFSDLWFSCVQFVRTCRRSSVTLCSQQTSVSLLDMEGSNIKH